MKPISVITALLVSAALYMLVMERDTLHDMTIARFTTPQAEAPEVAEDAALTTDEAGADAGAENGAGAETDAETGGAMRVVALKSTAQEIDSAVIVRGETAADRQVTVMAETSGRVVSTPIRAGATVQEGDILCEIDKGTRGATLTQAEAALESARIEMTQAEKLSKDGYASQTRLTAARAGLEQAQATLEAAQKEIERTTMTAPFAGVLDSDTAELGALLQPGSACATVLQLDPVKLVGYIPETEVSRVELGARGGARLTTGEMVEGRVRFLARSADPQTRTFKVEIEVPNPGLTIRDGQTAEIMIAAPGAIAHLLPQSALTLNDDGALGVRIVQNDSTVGFAPVELMRDTARGVWVTGLPETANVIVVGQEYVTSGVEVAPVYRRAVQ